MASLSTLRSLFYLYLGTTSSDPAYPTTTVDALLNAAGNKYVADVHQMNPSYLVKSTTLTSTTHSYTLPADFAGWLDVRVTDATGSPLREVRDDELNEFAGGAMFAVIGADQAATLTTSDATEKGVNIYLKYRYQPAEMVAASDVPSWMPTQYHDLLAREAALDGFGLGGEQMPTMLWVDELHDRRAQFWQAVGKRGVRTMETREQG